MKKQILIIDDQEDLLEILEEWLTGEGLSVATNLGNTDVFELISEYQPDIILIDFILNGVNGGMLCKQIKANPQTSSLPVIIFSAYSWIIKNMADYQCDSFIEKPFELPALLNKIVFYINKNQL